MDPWQRQAEWFGALTPERVERSAIAPELDGPKLPAPNAVLATDGTWSLLTAGLPPARVGPGAVYDPLRRRMLVFGGSNAAYLNDVWALTLVAPEGWVQLSPTGTLPPPRRQPAVIYDPVRDRLIVFGGTDGSFRNDLWALSLSGTPAWTQLAPAGALPAGRAGHVAIYDPVGDRLIVFGGYDGVSAPSSRRNDVWALSLSGTPAWSELSPAGTAPSARSSSTAIYDPVRQRMVMFGGTDPAYRNDVWALSLSGTPAWSELMPGGTAPAAREEHSAIYDAARDRMVVFGGYDADYIYGDCQALAFSGAGWSQVSAGDGPSPRWGHRAAYDRDWDRMVVFGGRDASWLSNETWLLSWDQPTPVELSLLSADAEAGWVRLCWYGAGRILSAVLERRRDVSDWSSLAVLQADGTGRLEYTDRSVVPGARYAYRVRTDASGTSTLTPEVWVEVPQQLSLAIAPPSPNPATGPLVVSFTLPDAGAATLELMDVGGRRIVRHEVGSLGPGRHVLRIDPGRVTPGVYWLRLTHSDREVRASVTLLD